MATGTLTGTTIASTYKSLLRIGSGSSADNTVLDADLQIVEDGDGNNSCLQLSTDQVLVKDASGTDVASCFEVQDKDGTVCLSVNGTNNNVGIGTAAPTIKLTVTESAGSRVASFINSHAAAPYGILIDYSNDDPNGAGNSFIDCDDSSATRFALLSNGQIKSVVHYATAAGSTQTALYVDDSGFFGKVTSLREHKKKISDMEDISWLYNIRPVNFEYKVRETEERINRKGKSEQWPTGKWLNEADGIKQYGVIAEEVAEVSGAESLLEYDGDTLSGVSYHKFVPILVKAIQELSAKVEALENA